MIKVLIFSKSNLTNGIMLSDFDININNSK